MKRSTDRILTTHAGSLPRPQALIELNRARSRGELTDECLFANALTEAVAETVRQQKSVGVDIVDDGEFGKAMTAALDYGVWWNYAYARLGGFSPADKVAQVGSRRSSVANVGLTVAAKRRDFQQFNQFYLDPEATSLQGSLARRPGQRPVCTGPIKYTGHATVQADIENLKMA